jgi:hypothetical protein
LQATIIVIKYAKIQFIFRLVQSKAEDIIAAALEDFERSGGLTIEDLARINPDAIVPKLVSKTTRIVGNCDLRVNMNDYAIFLTPEGQVYDRTSIDNLKESNDNKNIKRENKVII